VHGASPQSTRYVEHNVVIWTETDPQPKWEWSADCLGPAVDPDQYFVFANKLYLFRNDSPRTQFIGQAAYNVFRGDQRWKNWFPTGQSQMNTKCIK
jgi:hypothetical protein